MAKKKKLYSTEHFAENIDKYIKDNNLSNAKLGEQIDASPQLISHWRNGLALPSPEKLCEMQENGIDVMSMFEK